VNPRDSIHYSIASDVIEFTERILKEYDPHEGIVYWAGISNGHNVSISLAIAPQAKTHEGQFVVDHLSNAKVVLCLHKYKQSHIGQVHSHPSSSVDHSGLDDRQAAFRREGLLSLVVPWYGCKGMLPLTECGVHRFKKKTFIRMGNKYVINHFRIVPATDSILIDQRNGKRTSQPIR
jgi:hypothetical protein